MDVDVNSIMLRLLETQKEYVLRDLEAYSRAIVTVFTADSRPYIQFPKFEDEASKIAGYTAIVNWAKANGAMLILTVNNARIGSNEMAAKIEEYCWGDYGELNSRPCILMTASGPGVESCSASLGFEIADGMVPFDPEPEFLSGVVLNLLPDWPGDDPRTAN